MTTTAELLTKTRLFHDEALATIVDRALAGRRVFVAASTIDAGRALMRELVGFDTTWTARARYFWANGQERIKLAGAGSVVFNSINSTRIHGVTADVALVNYHATENYFEWLLPALVLGGTLEPELFEIDA